MNASASPDSAPPPPAPALFSGDTSPRRRQILEIAAQLFARHGYQGTSIRDIGERAGLLGGSLYHYIKSKDALFVEIHHAALESARQAIETAIARYTDPWLRLEAACRTLLEIQLAPDSLTLPLMNDFRRVPPSVQDQMIATRDAFEDVFRRLVDELPIPAEIDRRLYRILLLSLLNSAGEWYQPGRLTPTEIGAQVVRIFRHETGAV